MINDDLYNLNRFIEAQEAMYESVLAELRSGQKRSHWMWFIFPQIDGLGKSSTSKYYSIKSVEEAKFYLKHHLLGTRLLECTETVLAIDGKSLSYIFGSPDDVKFKSCMTLFASITNPESVFEKTLNKYFNGKRDNKTLVLLRIKAR